MDSVEMRSPPISRPIDARSSVVATTFSLSCARTPVIRPDAANRARTIISFLITTFSTVSGDWGLVPGSQSPATSHLLKRMRPVRANRELHLEQQLVGDRRVPVYHA